VILQDAQSHRRDRIASVAFACAALVAGLTLFLGAAALVRSMAGSSSTLDFSSFYTAGQIVRDGASLYDVDLQATVQRSVSGENFDEPLPFAAPAFVAIVFVPLTLLPLRGALALMLLLNVAALVGLLAMLRAAMPDVPEQTRRLVLVGGAVSIPAVSILTAGQIDLIVTAALVAGMLLIRAERPVAAGLVLSLSLAKPQLALGAILLLAFTRDWRPLVTMLGAGAILAVVPVTLLGTHAITGNVAVLDEVGRPALMANWRGFLVSAGLPDDMRVWGPGWLVISVGAVCLFLRVCIDQTASIDRRWALAFLLPLVLSPHLQGQSLIMVVPAVALYLQSHAAIFRPVYGSSAWEKRAELVLATLFILLFARWALTLAGLSLTVFLVVALVAAAALPDRWRLLPDAEEPASERLAA